MQEERKETTGHASGGLMRWRPFSAHHLQFRLKDPLDVLVSLANIYNLTGYLHSFRKARLRGMFHSIRDLAGCLSAR